MATTGLEVFDKTLHTTNLWLDEISAEIGPDRQLAWHVLGAVLRSLRDEMQVEQSAHFAAQLPLIIRGAYFDQYRPALQPASVRSQDEFIARIQRDLDDARPVKTEQAIAAVMRTLSRHVTEGQIRKVRDALPKGVRAMWPEQQAQHAGTQARHASSQPPAAQQAAPQHSASPPPQHLALQSSLHPASRRPAREWEEIEEVEPAKKSAQVPRGAGRPAGLHAAPAAGSQKAAKMPAKRRES